jgi:hypothetical protein
MVISRIQSVTLAEAVVSAAGENGKGNSAVASPAVAGILPVRMIH